LSTGPLLFVPFPGIRLEKFFGQMPFFLWVQLGEFRDKPLAFSLFQLVFKGVPDNGRPAFVLSFSEAGSILQVEAHRLKAANMADRQGKTRGSHCKYESAKCVVIARRFCDAAIS